MHRQWWDFSLAHIPVGIMKKVVATTHDGLLFGGASHVPGLELSGENLGLI